MVYMIWIKQYLPIQCYSFCSSIKIHILYAYVLRHDALSSIRRMSLWPWT